MKILYFPLFLALLATDCQGTARAESGTAPGAATILEQLFRHAAMEIGNIASCSGVFADQHDHTLGRFIAEQLANMTEAGENRIALSCQPAAGTGWRCDLAFRHNDPAKEVMSTYGVRLSLDGRGRLQEKGLACTGAG